MSEYPDHLNPFKRSGLRESFRSMKSAFNIRFRKKDRSKDRNSVSTTNSQTEARLRHGEKTNGVQVPRSETIIGTTGTPEMLPRSRFTERVARSHTMDLRNVNNPNPFDEDDKSENTKGGVAVKVSDTARRGRRKKRAPLPPGARNNLTVPGEHNNSQWSIDSYTSYDTDYSTTAHTHSENEDAHSENAERLKDIQEISKEIQQVFCDTETTDVVVTDKQLNVTSEEIKDDKPPSEVIPASVETDTPIEKIITSNEEVKVNGDVQSETEVKEDTSKQETEEKDENAAVVVDNNTTTNKEVVEKVDVKEDVHPEEINNNIQDETRKSQEHQETISNGHTEIKEQLEPTPEEKKNEDKVNCDTPEHEKSTDINNKTVSTDVQEEKPENNGDADVDVICNSDNVAYVDRKSIFIAGSTDNLDVHQCTETTLFITGSCDQLDSNKAPTPKMRKHKLGRETMLGSAGDSLNICSEKQ